MALHLLPLSVNNGVDNENGVNYVISDESRKWLHCLSCYPNEFWKYPTSVFFLEKINSEAFDNDSFNADFQKMLQKLLAFLLMKFIDRPTVNAIKDDIYQSCISLVRNNELTFRDGSTADVIKQLENPALIAQQMSEQSTSKFSKALILLSAYLHEKQTGLIDKSFEIEHIFPRKWQVANYNGWSEDEAQLYLERFGNKIAFEKKLNIKAGNGYFGQKKNIYKGSKIACAQNLSQYSKDDWVKEDIEAREEGFKSGLINFFKSQLIN